MEKSGDLNMTDVLTKQERSYNMSQIKGKDTQPEIKLRKEIFSSGLKGHKIHKKIAGKPDIVFPKQRIAVFIDGCFWHKCPKCYQEPKTNNKFWSEKINANKRRDKKVNTQLKKDGWTILRFWEHEIKVNSSRCVEKIKNAVLSNKLNVIDLFCGAGGMSHGFEKAGFNVLLGIDSNENAIKTFNKNHKFAKGLCKDMTSLSVNEIKQIIRNKRIDVIVGGPPCQGFSMAGKRRPNDPRNSLFREYLRVVKGLKPKLFVMENVRGLLSMKDETGKKVIDIILDEFNKAGYNATVQKVNTADYGVPQKRHRIFIIGIKNSSSINFSFPEQTHSKTGVSKDGKKIRFWNNVKNILIEKEGADKNLFYSEKLINGFKRREENNKKRNIGFGWSFINPDEPSYTISARYWKDGAEALVKYDEETIRMLSSIECALIQSFPKKYKFVGNKKEIYSQIGNAVPPAMAEKIAKNIYEGLKC